MGGVINEIKEQKMSGLRGVLADRSNPYWDMLLLNALVDKWTNIDPDTLEKTVNWSMVSLEKTICEENLDYNPFRGIRY